MTITKRTGSEMSNGWRTLDRTMRHPAMEWPSKLERGSSATNRLSCGIQPANIRLINRRKCRSFRYLCAVHQRFLTTRQKMI